MNLSNEHLQPCTQEILEVVPLIMQSIRCEMRKRRATGLSVPQLRVLVYLNRHPGSALNALAEHLGLTSPSAFSLVEGLLAKGLVARDESTLDRRRVSLNLTAAGEDVFQQAQQGAQNSIAERLSALGDDELSALLAAFHILRPLFSAEPAAVLKE